MNLLLVAVLCLIFRTASAARIRSLPPVKSQHIGISNKSESIETAQKWGPPAQVGPQTADFFCFIRFLVVWARAQTVRCTVKKTVRN